MNKLWNFSINLLCLFGFVFVVFALVVSYSRDLKNKMHA